MVSDATMGALHRKWPWKCGSCNFVSIGGLTGCKLGFPNRRNSEKLATVRIMSSMERVDENSVNKHRFTITRPDDWHLHVRDGDSLGSVASHSAQTFGRAIIMPNLKPPVTTVALAASYRNRILSILPLGCSFEPLMTIYLTDATTGDEIKLANCRKLGVEKCRQQQVELQAAKLDKVQAEDFTT